MLKLVFKHKSSTFTFRYWSPTYNFFCDESRFWLNGSLSKQQNYRFWSENNPHHILEKLLHSVTVWCSLWHGDIIESYFSKLIYQMRLQISDGDNGFFVAQVDRNVFVWHFFLSKTVPHVTLLVLISLNIRVSRRIRQFRSDLWPPRSCDFTSLITLHHWSMRINNRL